MKISLFYKLILTQIGVIFALVCGLLGLFFAFNENMVSRTLSYAQDHVLGRVADGFAAHYERHQGWSRLNRNPTIARHIVSRGLKRAAPQRIASDQEPLFPVPFPVIHHLLEQASIYDSQGQLITSIGVVENRTMLESQAISVPIFADDREVGHLVVHGFERFRDNLRQHLLRRQMLIVGLIGFGGSILAIIASIMLTRHLTAPLRQIQQVTHQLTQRNFSERVQLRSGDELGDLGASINSLAGSLERYEQLQQDWLYDVAHELRTPVMVMLSELDAILMG